MADFMAHGWIGILRGQTTMRENEQTLPPNTTGAVPKLFLLWAKGLNHRRHPENTGAP